MREFDLFLMYYNIIIYQIVLHKIQVINTFENDLYNNFYGK